MYEAIGIIALLAMPIVLTAGLIRPKLVMPWVASPKRWHLLPLEMALFAILAFAAINDGPHPKTSPSEAAVSAPSVPGPVQMVKTEPVAARPTSLTMPKPESDFIAAIGAARAAYADSPNELKKSNVKIDMVRAIHAAVPGGQAQGWVGILKTIGTNGEGNAYVTVEIADGIAVQTWNNAFSDMEDGTLIKNRSPLYNALADMKEGERVVFNARLHKLSDLTERGAVEQPEMIATFNRIEPAH